MDETLTELQEAVLFAVKNCEGRQNAVRKSSLAFRFSVDPRTIRGIVGELREMGYPVLCSSASNGGYYWPETPEEVHVFIKREITSRASHLHKQEAALRRNLHVHFGQMEIK